MKTAALAEPDTPVPRVVERIPPGERPIETWAASILPSGELVPDDVTVPRSKYDTGAPSGTWNSQHPRQELAVQALAAATTIAIFVAPVLFVAVRALELQVPTPTFWLASFAVGAAIAAVFGKKLRLGERGVSLMRVPKGLRDVDQMTAAVHRAASKGGWAIEPGSTADSSRTWRVETAHTLWYFVMVAPERHYLHLETIGRQFMERHARLKGLILQEMRDAPRAATPGPPGARAAIPLESGGVEDPTPAEQQA